MKQYLMLVALLICCFGSGCTEDQITQAQHSDVSDVVLLSNENGGFTVLQGHAQLQAAGIDLSNPSAAISPATGTAPLQNTANVGTIINNAFNRTLDIAAQALGQ